MNTNSDEKVENHEDLSDLENFERTELNIFGLTNFEVQEFFQWLESFYSLRICLTGKFDYGL